MVAATLAALTGGAQASGYRFGSQSVAAQGTADANGAEAADPSTIFYNPAGLARLDGLRVSAGATVVLPHSRYTDLGSTHFTGQQAGGSAASGYVPDAAAAPSFYVSRQIDQRWTAGLGVFVPYGAKLDFGRSWTGRYALTDMKLEAVTLNPSASFKLDQHHAFGFGVSAERMHAALGQAVDVPGTIAALSAPGAAAQSAALARQIVALGGNPALLRAAADGHGSNDVKDWGWGFNLGYLWTPDAATRFGLSYRSSIAHQLRGSTVWDFSTVTPDPIVNQVLAAASHRANSAALVAIRTPETLSLQAFHQFNRRWAGMADLTWTRHNRLDNLNIEFPGTGEGAEVIRQQWRNTARLALGANYAYSEAVTLRTGVAYDQSPVKAALAHPALPDGDRVQYSVGGNWKLDAHASIDLAYSYVQVKAVTVDYTNSCTPLNASCTGNGETTRGRFQTHVSLMGLAYNYQF
jgi:long-chain fatty acid transport protein